MFSNSQEAKRNGWFSRRNKISEGRDSARLMRKLNEMTKAENVSKRTETATSRSPQEQVRLLDGRLGKGVGAQKERAKLQARITSASRNRGSRSKKSC